MVVNIVVVEETPLEKMAKERKLKLEAMSFFLFLRIEFFPINIFSKFCGLDKTKSMTYLRI